MIFHKTYQRITPWWRFFTADFIQIEDWSEYTYIFGFDYEDDVARLTPSGELTAKVGFVHGASGLTVDHLPLGIFRKQLKSQRRGVCKHDLLYHLSQKGVFEGPKSKLIKSFADCMLRDDIITDGGWRGRATTWEFFVEKFGDAAWGPKG